MNRAERMLLAQEPSARYLAAEQPALVREFELLAMAPGGVARLRDLILSLAVRGKLVPQNLADEPASVMLSRLVASRSKGRKKGISADLFDVANCDPSTFPCDLPAGWAWIRLSDLGEFCGGKTPSKQNPTYWSGSIPWITPKDMKQLRLADSEDHVSPAAIADGLAAIPRHSLLIVVRSGILRRTVPVAINEVEATINQDLKALKLTAPEMVPYLQLLVRGFETFILETLTKVGTTVESIRFDDFAAQPFPLPPAAEQARIVARVDELMRLCDALEAQGRLEAEQHARLLGTLLGTLTDSSTPEELAANWQRVADHFDLLLDRPEAVDALEQTILQLAVRGLLVPQDPRHEPAGLWVRRINSHRVYRRTAAALPTLADTDRPDLPVGWCVTNVWSVAECLDYIRRPMKKADREAKGGSVPYYGANGQVGWINEHLFDEDLVLVVEDETFIGRTKPFSYVVRGKSWVNNHAHVLRPLGGLSADFLNLCLERYDFIPLTSGTTNRRKLTQPGLLNAEFMIGPLEEQVRILARVTELRRLCADLRQRLTASQTTQSHLAEAFVDTAVD